MSVLGHVLLGVVLIVGVGMFEAGLLVAWYQWTEPLDIEEVD